MVTAPASEQRQLLEIQDLDTRIAQLNHQRRTHDTLDTLAELRGRADDLNRALTQAQVELTDVKQEVIKAETDVEQVESRAQRSQEQLNSGQGSPKELQNLAAEIEALMRRKDVLEEAQLEAMEKVEQAQQRHDAIEEQLNAIIDQISAVEQERDEAFTIIDSELETVSQTRQRLSEEISSALLDIYEHVRTTTGGLGAVALRGDATVGINVPLSLTEIAEIKQAPEDQVIQSEDYDYILVRVDD